MEPKESEMQYEVMNTSIDMLIDMDIDMDTQSSGEPCSESEIRLLDICVPVESNLPNREREFQGVKQSERVLRAVDPAAKSQNPKSKIRE